MRIFPFYLVAFLMCLMPLTACGTDKTSQLSPLSQGESQMLARDVWRRESALYRLSLAVETISPQKVSSMRWFFMERTPHDRMKVISRVNPMVKLNEVTILEQGNTILALKGEDVEQPFAPWMMGAYLWGESLSPRMVMSWATGLPGKSYSTDSPEAQLRFSKEKLDTLSQEGWEVKFVKWRAPSSDTPSLPQQFSACKNETCLMVTVVEVQAFPTPPAGYNEFKIM